MRKRERAKIQALIDRLPFRAARAKNQWGQPQVPHEYTVRCKGGSKEDYFALFEAIQAHGVDERYSRSRRKYLYLGDGWKYWAMTTEMQESRVLNRMRVEDDYDRLRKTRQAVRDKDGKPIEPPELL